MWMSSTLDGHHTFHLSESYVMAGAHAKGVALLDRAVTMGFYPADYYERSRRPSRAHGGAATSRRS
jgi:hypothetical protein